MASKKQKAKERYYAHQSKEGKYDKKSKSFNYKSLGISDDVWNSLGSDGQSAMSVIGKGVMKIIDKNQPLPEVLDDKEMNKLWKEAESDPVIQKEFGDEMNIAKDYLNKNIDLVSAEFKSLTEDQQREYIDAKKQTLEAQASLGTAYSGFRKQAEEKLGTQQSGIIESSRRQLQQQLNQIGQQFEQRFGTGALGKTKLGQQIQAGKIGGYTGDGYAPVGYIATGGITGTQASDILAAKLQKQQDLAGEELQKIELENIQREKKQQEALKKLNI